MPSEVALATGTRAACCAAVAVLALLLGTGTASAVTLEPATGSPFAVGGDGPNDVAAGDLDGDGRLDLATANIFSGDMSIFLGNGSGGFSAAAGSPLGGGIGGQPLAVAIGDLDADGKPDLAVADGALSAVRVLLGDGTGAFASVAGSPFSAGAGPASVAIGDVDRDGEPDLAVADRSGTTISILIGHGDGTFAAPTAFTVGAEPRHVVLADLNRDGRLDAVVAVRSTDSVAVLLGNGHGGFVAAVGSPFAAGDGPIQTVVRDLDGHGTLDVVVLDLNGNAVSVLPGLGSGRLGPPAAYTLPSTSYGMALADLDRDGALDIVAARASSGLSVLSGDGSAGFAAPVSIATGEAPIPIAVGDFDGDGHTDVAVGETLVHQIRVLLNRSAPAAGLSAAALSFPS